MTELPELLLELRQRGLVHRLDVQVADSAAGELIHEGPSLLDPSLIAQVAEGRQGDRLVLDLPGPLGDGLVIQGQLDLAIEPPAEEGEVVIPSLDWLAVDGDQVVP